MSTKIDEKTYETHWWWVEKQKKFVLKLKNCLKFDKKNKWFVEKLLKCFNDEIMITKLWEKKIWEKKQKKVEKFFLSHFYRVKIHAKSYFIKWQWNFKTISQQWTKH